jgi:prepilin-type N-terminal cleavage/methylation domain-containing protein
MKKNRAFSEFFKNSKAFTLIEVLVMIAIIGLLSVLVLPNYRQVSRQTTLQSAANKLAQDIRNIQSMTMSSKDIGLPAFRGAFGVYFKLASSTSYALFADKNNSGQYDTGEELDGKSVYLDAGISISGLTASPLTIIFTPPNPNVTIQTGASTSSLAEIIFSNGSQSKKINVNIAGLVYVGN